MRKINKQDLEAIALGSTVLGTGGGGDPYIGKLMAQNAIEQFGEVSMLSPEEVPDDALVVPVAAFGAPVILLEKLFSGKEAIAAFDMMEAYYGKKIYATMPAEAGGLNGVIPFAVAAEKQIPIVDADGMGRAYPRLEMVTFTLHGIPSSPITQADEKGNRAIYHTINNVWGEIMVGSTVIPMGGSCFITCYPMTGKQMKEASVLGVISHAERIGQSILKAKEEEKDPLASLLEVSQGKLIFQGKIIDVGISTEGRWNKGVCRLMGLGPYSGKEMVLDFQNEFLIAKVGDQVLASVPDLITVLDLDTAEPITAEVLQYGYRLNVIAMPCDDQWKTEAGIKLGGPEAFGYENEYTPI
ncbi:MAG: DUF917 domain-containing protein [Bacteroidota bacterium]